MSGNQVSLNIFDLIDSICREFRGEWKQGKRPRLEDWFGRVPGPAQTQLFRNLLEIEVNYRRRGRETVSSDEYIKRFPNFEPYVRQFFNESTLGSMEIDSDEPSVAIIADAQTRTFDGPAANRLGDYELLRELGRGGFGVVYEARHVKRGNRVALKTLPTGGDGQELNADRLHRFRKEFRSLSEINHPNLVGMQTLEVDGAQWFFTMDLIEGEDFLSFVRPRNVVNEERLRAALKQLARGIMALHQRGIIHRDLKPSNVLVESDGRVAILDFGLVAELQKVTDVTQTRSGMFAGTPRYAAPEQMFGQRSEASDWYALGVMLYECLTGELPFNAKNPMELLRQKQEQDPPSLSGRDDLPSDLTELVDGLLKRVPTERMGSAAIGARLQLESETRAYGSTGTAGSTGSSGSVADEEDPNFLGPQEEEIVLIGRETQLAQLEAARQDLLATRQPVVVWVTGLSGEGKSSLCEHFLRPLRKGQEMLVLSGRCYDRESVPFKVIDCWIDSLVSFLRSHPEMYSKVSLPNDLAGLAQIFPVLRRVSAIAKLPSIQSAMLTPETLRQRSFLALRELLIELSRTTPIVLFIDDLQWGDTDSLFAFKKIFAHPNPPAVMLLGSYRRGEVEQSPFLSGWKDASIADAETTVEIGPLLPHQAVELFARLDPTAAEHVQSQIHQAYGESGGNAFLLTQLLESFDRESGEFRPIPLRDVVGQRLERLPPVARTILEALAVYGKSVDTDEIGPLAGLPVTPFDTLTRMRNEKLVRELGGKPAKVDTFHDQIRETMIGQLSDDDRRDWHRRIGEKLEQLAGIDRPAIADFPLYDQFGQQTSSPRLPRLFDIAYHMHRAGSPAAQDYLILAAEESLRAYSSAEAARYFSWARQHLEADSPAGLRYRILAGFAEAQLRLRLASEAIELAQNAMPFASSTMERIQLLLIELKGHADLGQMAESISASDRALSLLKRPRPKTSAGKLGRVILGVMKCWLFPEFQLFDSPQRRKIAAKELEIHSAMNFVHASSSHFLVTMDSLLANAAAAFRSRERELVVLGHSDSAFSFSVFGFHRLAMRALLRFEKQVTVFSMPQLMGRAEFAIGCSYYTRGSFQESEHHLNRCVVATELSGDVYYGTLARHFLRHIVGWNGGANQEHAFATEELSHSRDTGNLLGMFWGEYACADPLARAGRLNEAAAYIQRAWNTAVPDRGSGGAVCHGTEAFLMLQASYHGRAQASCRASWDWTIKNWMFVDYIVRAVPLWIEAILGPDWIDHYPHDERQQIKRLSKWLRLLYRNLPNLQPMIERAWGRVAASRGKRRAAVRHFTKSAKLAEGKRMPYYRAKGLLDLAAVTDAGRDENRREAIRLLKEMESVIPRAEAWLLGDQYDEAVVAPEFDLAAWEREHGPISPQLSMEQDA